MAARLTRKPLLDDGLTLAHFTHQTTVISLYRQFLRSTRALQALPNRKESIDFYRTDFRLKPQMGRPPSPDALLAHLSALRRLLARVPWSSYSLLGQSVHAGTEWQTLGRGHWRTGDVVVLKKAIKDKNSEK
ncbi:Complex 1 LYR protein [Phaffia rhodozyma]|uniref:Complex 1 LYR protein n=1 Tax=Phaffia rhodozyma TaxID=264483 RepID=A0A0F7SH91_PHARH|nr:Complex 1 LYR protein [Phaffia rhodozyma]